MITSIIIMILSGIALYLYTRSLLENEIEEELYSNKDRVERLLEKNPDLVGIPPIMMAEKTEIPQDNELIDTLIYDPLQDEIELFKQLSGTKNINGQQYKITVRAMVIESEDILFAIVFTFMVIIFLGFIFLFYLNKSRNEKLWRPFFINLNKLKEFSVKADKPLNFEESEILEFHELNREMESLTAKIQTDYRNLRQFTEDVSHEMQTPLAIMQAKIETLINDQKINESQYEQLSSLQGDIQRLKQLNKRLILLAKIDNNQFTAKETISINEIIQQVIENFRELIQTRIIFVENSKISVVMDKTLAVILFNNLLANAVKHNVDNHAVEVIIEGNNCSIINDGNVALKQPESIFERFYKESKKADSTGLGLSIVKKICDYYRFGPSYSFRTSTETDTAIKTQRELTSQGQHIFSVDFNK
ncbi:sensor histidine kinase [Christiangramia antarctica]|uniref:histidine kinase n=2 Tax=Christiangramia TaxID=292691 RepID=A0ABW5X1S5_9FLAO